MTNHYHDTIPSGELVDASVFNVRLGQLDSTIREYLFGRPFTQLRLPTDLTATIDANGAIALSVMKGFVAVDTFAAAASDNLDTITLGAVFDASSARTPSIILTNADAARWVVVRHNVGNIFLSNAQNITLDDAKKSLQLFYNPATSYWSDVGQENLANDPVVLQNWAILGADSAINVTGIPQTANHLLIYGAVIRPVGASTTLYLRLNGDTGNNYAIFIQTYQNAGAGIPQYINAAPAFQWDWTHVGSYYMVFKVIIQNYTAVTVPKRMIGYAYDFNSGGPLHQHFRLGGTWKKATPEAVTQITIQDSATNTVAAGSIYAILGLK
jgi:hypothetical protein